jgi:hypothetical protein
VGLDLWCGKTLEPVRSLVNLKWIGSAHLGGSPLLKKPSPYLCVLWAKRNVMFGLFKQKSEKEKLQAQYEKLLKKSHELSTTNRAESDKVAAQAEEIAQKIEKL